MRNFDEAVLRLERLGRATDTGGGDVLTRLYRLTSEGELDDEEQRRPWLRKVGDELTRPANIAKVLIGAVGFVLGSAATLLAQRAF